MNPTREITHHIVEGDPAIHQLMIQAVDQAGPGGANHRYEIGPYGDGIMDVIQFQNGPIAEVGVNGITNEALLAIVIDRLRGFQAGQFKCGENAVALVHCEGALMGLQRRTRERIARGVEGTNVA